METTCPGEATARTIEGNRRWEDQQEGRPEGPRNSRAKVGDQLVGRFLPAVPKRHWRPQRAFRRPSARLKGAVFNGTSKQGI